MVACQIVLSFKPRYRKFAPNFIFIRVPKTMLSIKSFIYLLFFFFYRIAIFKESSYYNSHLTNCVQVHRLKTRVSLRQRRYTVTDLRHLRAIRRHAHRAAPSPVSEPRPAAESCNPLYSPATVYEESCYKKYKKKSYNIKYQKKKIEKLSKWRNTAFADDRCP